jgi:hypothetical protein
MLPLPVPQHGGSIETLNSFLNLASRDDFVLIVAWLLAALRSGGPYPLLAISGEQGSAKTVLSKLLKALIDPNAAPVRSLSREERELMIAANNGHLLAFDNLSGLPIWLSDALCRLASGGRIARPRILGALLDAVVHGLRTMGRVHLDRLPRMADFALWAAACETALWPAGTFARAYAANRRTGIEGMIKADPVATCVRGLMAERSAWTGSAADLLRAADFAGNEVWKKSAGWPKTPRALAGRLRRAQTFLRTLGIEVTFSREGRAGTRIRVTSAEHTVSTVSRVCHQGSRSESKHPQPTDDVRQEISLGFGRPVLDVGPSVTAADDADGADANAAFSVG